MIALLLLAAGCAPTIDPWLGAWTWDDAHLLSNTCPIADASLADTLGFAPLPVTLTVTGDAGGTDAAGTLCGAGDALAAEACEPEVDGAIALVSDAATWSGTLATGTPECAVTIALVGVLHRADACSDASCGVPGLFLDAELALDGEGCDAYEVDTQAQSGRDEALSGCDVSWYAAEP